MADNDYSRVPPPHLLKKFSEQARVDSQKRGHAGYCKTFAKLCIDWALDSQSTPNHRPTRSSDLDVTVALVQQWTDEIYGGPGAVASSDDLCLAKLAAQYGADQELDACCEWLEQNQGRWEIPMALREARRPQPKSLKEKALAELAAWCTEKHGDYASEGQTFLCDGLSVAVIREALEQLDD
jgi:hypothetical protein